MSVCSVARLLLASLWLSLTGASAFAQTADWIKDWDATIAAARKEGSLVASVPSGRGWREQLLKFQDAYPDIKLDLTPLASRDFWPRVQKEREAGQYLWDLRVGGADWPSYNMKDRGEMAAIRPLFILPEIIDDAKWQAGLDGIFLDVEKKYFPAFVAYESQSVYVNKAKLADAATLTIEKLIDPPWRGKISMADPRGGAALNTLSVIDKLYGDDFIRQLMVEQKPVITNEPRQQMDWLASGRYAIAFGLPTATLVEYAQRGADTSDFVKIPGLRIWSPGVGAVQMPTKAPHPNAAKLFVNWLLSRDVQGRLMQAVKLNSQRNDVPPGDPSVALDPKLIGQYIGTQSEDIEPVEQHVVEMLRSLPQ